MEEVGVQKRDGKKTKAWHGAKEPKQTWSIFQLAKCSLILSIFVLQTHWFVLKMSGDYANSAPAVIHTVADFT